MPVTRSQSGRVLVTPQVSDNPEQQADPTEELAVGPAPQPTAPLRHENPPESPSDPLHDEPSQHESHSERHSVRSSRRSNRQFQMAKKDEEIANLKLELAIAQKKTLALDPETSDDEDNHSIPSSKNETLKRTATWVNTQKNQAEEMPWDTAALTLEDFRNPTAAVPVSKPQKPTGVTDTEPQKKGDLPQKRQAPRAPIHGPSQEDRKLELSELARAISTAVHTAAPHKFYGKLPAFNGSHHEWLAFKSAYHESSSHYTPGENTARLRQSLVGKAKEAVRSLLIVNSNPGDIMKTLEDRFGRPDSIALAELEKLRGLQRTTDTPRDICLFANKVKNCVATLQCLNKAHYLASPETMKNIIEKLTPTLRYRWYDYAAEQTKMDSDLLQFSNFLEREAERSSRFAPPEQVIEESAQRTTKRSQRIHLTAKNEDSKNSCTICERKGHEAVECKSFTEANNDDRWTLAKKNNLCYRCLRHRKNAHKCPKRKCDVDGCERSHHPMLHFETKRKSTEDEKETERVASTFTTREKHAYLKIIPVQVSGPGGRVNTYALLDDGSTVTLVDAKIAKQISAEGPLEPLQLETISDNFSSGSSRRITLTIRGQDQQFDIQAHTIENLKLSSQTVEERHLWGCKHLEDLQQNLSYEDAKPTILIGQDNWHLLVATEIRRGNYNQLVASRTPLGWVLHGSDTRTIGRQVHFVHHINSLTEEKEIDAEERMDEQLKHYFALESIDIKPKQPRSDLKKRALAILEECTKEKEDGCFETALLWKNDNIELPSNYDNTLKRLVTTEKRIDKDAQLKRKYNEQIGSLIEKGYAERAPTNSKKGRTWYLPHFPVLNPMKPDKVRIVLDAAAKTKGQSLNDHLLTGPDLLQSLPGVLMRFREHKVAVTADIAEMFLRVGIRKEDRDALRYLWRGEQRDGPPDEYRMKSLIFGATSSPTTAIFVKNRNAEKYRSQYPAAVTAIVENHYMDDYLDSFKNEEQAIEISKQVRAIHSRGNFNLRGWASNSPETLAALTEDAQKELVRLDDGTKTERVLGLIWKPQDDKLTFNLELARIPPALLTEHAPTKRQALKIIMSVYDPLGIATPVTVKGKKIIQEVWRRGTDWDAKMDEDLAKQWTAWMKHMQELRNINVPRCYLQYSEASSLQLHVFVDASTTAYAAALYWRAETSDGNIHVSLITAKARVAPLKLTTVPRLELQAAVLGSRMADTVIEEHRQKPETRTFWTDSRTVLAWLRNGARTYKAYVAHRIAAIQETTTIAEWRWIPTKLNVADDATREIPANFDSEHRWFSGPQFLLQDPEDWPKEEIAPTALTGEEKSQVLHMTDAAPKNARATPDVSRFSKWERLLRATARVLQFIDKCRDGRRLRVGYSRTRKNKERDPDWRHQSNLKPKKQDRARTEQKTQDKNRHYLPVEADLLRRAEKQLVRLIQEESFHEEIEALRKGKAPHKTDRLRSLSVVLINDVVHLRGRVDAAAGVTDRQKNPPVLDGNHTATKLWVAYTHRKLLHAGTETTVNECRQHYWILRLRPIVKGSSAAAHSAASEKRRRQSRRRGTYHPAASRITNAPSHTPEWITLAHSA